MGEGESRNVYVEIALHWAMNSYCTRCGRYVSAVCASCPVEDFRQRIIVRVTKRRLRLRGRAPEVWGAHLAGRNLEGLR